MQFTFGKEYKLCGKTSIDSVFLHGKKIKLFPMIAYVKTLPLIEDGVEYKILISVPKKKIRKAHDRNYVKRCIRESIRLNQQLLKLYTKEINCVLHICIVYIWNESDDGKSIQENTKKLIEKLCKSNLETI